MRLLVRSLPAIFLLLRFASAADSVPRPEYPQPQFQRADWQTLNGAWEFEYDDGNKGLDQAWATGSHAFTRSIVVPFAPESRMSGIGDTSFHPWVWYRRTVPVPAGWSGRRVLLHFGAVDYRAFVWVNGERVGAHEGGNVPFTLDITPQARAESRKVTIVVRAEDPPRDRYIPRGKQYWEPQSKGIFYTRTTGIWQPVWLEATGESYLDHVRVTPSVDGFVRCEARIARPQDGLQFSVSIKTSANASSSLQANAEGPRATALLKVDRPRLWSPEDPYLYDVTFELRRGDQVLDRVQSYLGFRSVGVSGNRVTLNGRPIFLKMILDQGYWPESTLTAPTDEALKYDIQIAKDMGFNGARKHQKVEDPRYLYWADRLGYLVSGEMANAYLYDATYARDFVTEWTAAMERDYNHPSIIIWTPDNESWGVPQLADPRQQAHLRTLYQITHSLDDTRLVVDNDGWEHTSSTDLMTLHDYAKNGELLLGKYRNLSNKPGYAIPKNAREAMAPGNVYNGTPFVLSEFGGIAFIPPGANVPSASWGYSGVEKTAEDALARLRSLYEAIAKTPAWAGLCYTQLTDVEQEVNGLLTYDRKPKFDVQQVRRINELVK